MLRPKKSISIVRHQQAEVHSSFLLATLTWKLVHALQFLIFARTCPRVDIHKEWGWGCQDTTIAEAVNDPSSSHAVPSLSQFDILPTLEVSTLILERAEAQNFLSSTQVVSLASSRVDPVSPITCQVKSGNFDVQPQVRRDCESLHLMIDPAEGSCCKSTVTCTDMPCPFAQPVLCQPGPHPVVRHRPSMTSMRFFGVQHFLIMLLGLDGLKCTDAFANQSSNSGTALQENLPEMSSYQAFLPSRACRMTDTQCSFDETNLRKTRTKVMYRLPIIRLLDLQSLQSVQNIDDRRSLHRRFACVWHFAKPTAMAKLHLNHSPYCAARVGEAANPGPRQAEVIRLGITNPTSIISKVATYQTLRQQMQLDLITASETAATAKAQKQFANSIRKTFPRIHWSTPVPAHRHRSDGDDSLRGKAAGVAIMTTLHSREAIGTLEPEWLATCRIMHNVVTIGINKVQLITVYGVPSTQKDSATFNNDLLQQALDAITQINLPAIILGDFNVDPFTLPIAQKLQAYGFKDLKQLFPRLHAKEMPPTCRDVTHPDNALLSPDMQELLTQIEVHPEPWFDAHKVVILTFHMPPNPITHLRMSIPHSFLHLPLDESQMPDAYAYACAKYGEPTSIEAWGQTIEVAVDHAIRKTQMTQENIPFAQTQGLPKHCRGRCQPRAPKPCQRKTLTRPGRPGDYQPPGEIHSHATCKKVKQVRRLDSICRGLKKLTLTPTQHEVLTCEWKAVLACQAFKGNFIRWAQCKPEVGPLPINLPTYELAFTLYQLAKHETTIAIRQDQTVWNRKMQYRRHLDATLQGHKHAFAQLKKEMQPPLACLQNTEIRHAMIVSEDAHQRVYADNCNAFQMDTKVLIDQVPCSILEKDDNSLLVRPANDHEWPNTVELMQTQQHAAPDVMFELLQDYWQPFWTKSVTQPTEEQLRDILQTLPRMNIPECPEDPHLWEQAIKNLNPHSARGVDGISAQELRLMPRQAILHLMTIMNSYIEGFPLWMMWTRTMPVPKKDGIVTPAQIRPISVMAQLYRLWSKIQCKHVLSCIHSQLPKAITGFVPGKGPYDAIYEMQWYLEKAHNQGTATSGISIDLLKCFNTIDRESAKIALKKLGVPKKMLNQFFCSLQRLTRSWILPDAISPPKGTDRGFPQGDPMSVMTMIAIATAWIYMIMEQTPQAQIAAYADNWGWALNPPHQHARVIQDTQTFVTAFTMQVDWDKSWIWMTQPAQLPQLKRAIRQQLGDKTLTHLMNAMDLGGQMTYHGPPKLGKVQQRFQEAIRRLKCLQMLPYDVRSKALMVNTAVYTQAFYASAILPVGRKHTDTMRTQIADTLLGTSVSRNSAIAIHCMPFLNDPELILVINAVTMAHRFLHRCPEGEAHEFLKMVATHTGISHKCKGPAGCLKYYLGRLGWTIDREGNITVAAFRKYHFLSTSRQKWKRLLLEAWQDDLLSRFTAKKALKGLPPISSLDTTAVIRKFSRVEWRPILNEISGAFQCATQQAVWDPQTDPHCPHCGLLDTKFHRIFECTLTADLRSEISDTIDWMNQEGVEWHELPVIHVHPDREWHTMYHDQQLEPEIPLDMFRALQGIDVAGTSLQFYTDGSCQFPGHPTTRYASYAVVIDVASHDAERMNAAKLFAQTNMMPSSLHTLCVGRTPGDQSIHRSELLAIVYICERFYNTNIHTDSTVALAAIRECLKPHSRICEMEDFDLLLRLRKVIHLGNRQFHKVRAHSETEDNINWMTLYHRLGNKKANDSAITANQGMQPTAVAEFNCVHDDLQTQRHHLQQLFGFHLKVIRRHAELVQSEAAKPNQRHFDYSGPSMDDIFEQFSNYNVELPWIMPTSQMKELRQCAWGNTIANKVMEWAMQLKWPQQENLHPLQDDGVTWIELVLSFTFSQRIFLPLRREGREGKQLLVPFANETALGAYQGKLSELAQTFAILCKQITELQEKEFLPPVEKGLVRSLYKLGSNIFSSGFKWRPWFPAQTQVLEVLRPYLRTHRGPAYAALPDFPFVPDEESYQMIRSEIKGDWAARSNTAQKAMRKVRSWRKHPVARLSFA
jgi:hypothetical protein